jgi:APA family basic amino acid/polyamine antiporter
MSATNMLKRDISKLGSYATLIGMMVGAGIFVAIGEAGRDAGPSTWLAYLLLGPVTLLAALPYIIFHSTSIGSLPGGAYIHISRTFRRPFPGYIFMWLAWVTYLGVLATLAIAAGRYISVFVDGIDPRIIATICLLFFFIINIIGVKYFDRLQSAMFLVLLTSIILLVVPGVFSIEVKNFVPLMPNGFGGFIKALPILFFAYGGFDALAQTAGEVENPQAKLPKIFLRGVLISVGLYVAISVVTFGALPFTRLIQSTTPVADAASTFLPFGSHIVAIGALMAFFTTINACMLVPSRILYAFAQDRIVPPSLAKLNSRFNTPHVSLIVNAVIAVALVWTKTLGMLISIAMQATILMYIAECAALAALPFMNKKLWSEVRLKIGRVWITTAGCIAVALLSVLYFRLPNPFNPLLITWTGIGLAIYGYERFVQNKRSVDELVQQLKDVFPSIDSESTPTEGEA